MEDENIKQLIYDIQREKNSQKQVDLVKTFVDTSKLHYYTDQEKEKFIEIDKTKIVPAKPVAQINELSADESFAAAVDWHKTQEAAAVDWHKTQEGKDEPFIFHKFAVGTKIQFPTFEKLRLEGWVDDGESMVHPKYKTIFLSYMQIADFEDTVVTIAYQNNPGEYSIKEEGLYDDWPFDLMNVVNIYQPCAGFSVGKPESTISFESSENQEPEKLEWDRVKLEFDESIITRTSVSYSYLFRERARSNDNSRCESCVT